MSNRCLIVTEEIIRLFLPKKAKLSSGFLEVLDYEEFGENKLSNDEFSDGEASDNSNDGDLIHSKPIETDYSLEQHFQEQFYASTTTYAFSSESPVKNITSFYDDEEYSEPSPEENTSETLTTPQAEETMEEVCLAKLLGTNVDVSYIARRKLANWILFNPAYFHFFESNALTREVSYTAF